MYLWGFAGGRKLTTQAVTRQGGVEIQWRVTISLDLDLQRYTPYTLTKLVAHYTIPGPCSTIRTIHSLL